VPEGPRDSPAPDEWAVGKLDLDAYLHRIGYDGPAQPSEATLGALHRAHLAAIPFENLNLMLGRGIRVDLESIQAKLVYGERGGYCYEHGQLFGAALERLGFHVDRLLARVGPDGTPTRPRTHLTLRVQVPEDGGTWLADVGFGSSPPAPRSLGPRSLGPRSLGPPSLRGPRSGGRQDLDGWIYGVVPDETAGTGRTWKLRELQGAGEWVTLYRYEDQPAYPADVVMSNHFTSTHPESWFTQLPVVIRRDVGAIRSLLGRTYTVTRPGHVKERRVLSDEEFAVALGEVFGLTFTADELAALVAFPLPRER
jgi:N-hydroxyarylamine O-acetyltransferase